MVASRSRAPLSAGPSPRSIKLSYIGLTLLAAVLLTARYKLLAPDGHAYGGAGSSIGHQAYELAFKAGQRVAAGGATPNVDAQEGTTSSEDEGDEWFMFAPTIEWDPLSDDTRPITEVTVKSCVLPPGLYDVCSPTSSKKEDALRGEWERVDRDLNKRIGITYLYLFVRRLLPGSQSPVVTNLTLLTHAPTTDDLPGGGAWAEVSESVRDGVWPRMYPMFLHYQVTPQSTIQAARKSSQDGTAGILEPITNLDVSYGGGEVHALPGYDKLPVMITGGTDDEKRVDVATGKGSRVGSTIAFRRTLPKLPIVPDLRFSAEGKFKLLQVADLHFSVGPGECRDMDPKHEVECKKVGADVYSLAWLNTALDRVKPNLVVLSGDQLNGQDTSWSAESTILKWAPILYERQIPWTIIYGNHDGEKTDLDLAAQMKLYTNLPYFVGEAGPAGVDGVGNYLRSIRAPTGSTTLFNLYFLDSHAYVKALNPWAKQTYDFIKPAQINWLKSKSSRVSTLKRPYSPSNDFRPRTPTKRETSRLARFVKRQDDEGAAVSDEGFSADGFPGDLTDELTSEQVAKLEEILEEEAIEDELEAQLEDDLKAAVESGEGFSAAVEPDDGSNIETGIAVVQDVDEIEAPEAEEASAVNLDLMELDQAAKTRPSEVATDGPTAKKPFVAKPNAMAFFHIPLPESYSAADVGADGTPLLVGERYEGSGASKTNGGFFEQAILKQKEQVIDAANAAPIDEFWDSDGQATTGRPEIKVIANGHCHITEDCRRVQGVWLCFGGGGSFSGYGKGGFARRMRVYELKEFGERIETYKILDNKDKTETTVLVGDDALGN